MADKKILIYAHRIRGEDAPFYFGSGRPSRPENFERGAEWRSYVAGRLGPDFAHHLDQIEVAWEREYRCEGQMRFEECMLAAENNAPGNRVGAARASVDMLTGLLKGARPCGCGLPDCRRKTWLAMTPEEQNAEMRRQLALASRNRVARGETPINIEGKMREYGRRREQGHHWFHDT